MSGSNRDSSGHILTELAVAMAVFAMVVGAAISAMHKNQRLTRQLSVQARVLITLDNAVERFRAVPVEGEGLFQVVLSEEFEANHLHQIPGLTPVAEVEEGRIRLKVMNATGKEVAGVFWEKK